MSASQDLARRAVACKAWRWMPGMRDCWGARVLDIGPSGLVDVTGPRLHGLVLASMLEAPDLEDPATLGCLLALVREAWGIDVDSPLRLLVSDYGSGCCIEVGAWGEPLRFELDAVSLAEALVAALEAAP